MPISHRFWPLFLLFGSFTTAHAADPDPIEQTHADCVAKNSTTQGMVECTVAAEKQWDAALNQAYQALRNPLNEKQKSALKKSQLNWLQYRDAEFQWIAEWYGTMDGTMWRVVGADARAAIVKARVLELRAYLDGIE